MDLAHPFAPGNFLEIERSMIAGRPQASASATGSRWTATPPSVIA